MKQSRFLWLTVGAVCAASIAIIFQIVARWMGCTDLICQLRYAATYSNLAGTVLGAFVLLGAALLVLVLAVLQLTPKRLASVGRFCILSVCIAGVLLTLRIAAIETFLLHGWSWSCVAASWISVLLLGSGVVLSAAGRYPATRFQGAVALAVAVVVGGLSWHLMQTGGITRVRKLDTDPRLLLSSANHSLGPASARLQIVEFADFECPPCRHVAPELQALLARYNGQIRLVQRELPNERLHPQAQRAAEIAECFGEQGKFWEAAGELYHSPSVPNDRELGVWAARMGLVEPELTACIAQHKSATQMLRDRQDARALGVYATPTLFIGNTVLEGSAPLEKLDALVRYEIAGHTNSIASANEQSAGPRSGCAVQPEAESTDVKKDKETSCH
jgi:protein-disulfide isomerase